MDINRQENSFTNTIKERYGSPILKLTRRLQTANQQVARFINHQKFMKKCRDNDIIPKGFRSKKSIRETENPSLNRMNKKLEEKRLRSEINNAKTKQSTLEQEIKRFPLLSTKLPLQQKLSHGWGVIFDLCSFKCSSISFLKI